ncbi:MAG: hypothetical protein JXR48_04855 [Candidatus Delongbacteria bacterium]|nr:hypothetical protein [Candidatus Delongbacteria bacterium]MBN2834278.1 hypothetical protein [Candidatus Delongbacteria bacterium]
MLRKLYYNAVLKIFEDDLHIESLYDDILKNLEEDQKRYLVNLINTFFRHFRYIERVYVEQVEPKLENEKIESMMLLLCAGVEWIYLDRSVYYAIVNEYVELAKRVFGKYKAGFINAVLRKFTALDKAEILNNDRDYLLALDDWSIDKIKTIYGDQYIEMLKFFQTIPPVFIRCNTFKISLNDLLDELKKEEIICSKVDNFQDFLKVESGNITTSKLFENGFFYIQDPSHSLPVLMLEPKKNETILDLCCAPGGKSTYIQQLTHNKVKLYLNDVSQKKRVKIKHNFKRMGFKFEKLTFMEGEKFKLFMDFDKILIDAPCSGSGNFRRHPESRWNKDEEDLKDLVKLQYEILFNASFYLKKDGIIVYSTCSIYDEENIEIIRKFINENPDFIIDSPPDNLRKYTYKDNSILVNPGRDKMEGSFACRIKRIK